MTASDERNIRRDVGDRETQHSIARTKAIDKAATGPNSKPPAVDAASTKLAVANEPVADRANRTNATGIIVLATPRPRNDAAGLRTTGERRGLL